MKKIQASLQTFSGAMMVPIILFVLVGFYVAIGAGLTQFVIPKGNFVHDVVKAITGLGFMFMSNLQIWFAVGIAFSLSKKEKGWGAFAGIIMYFCLISVIQTYAGLQGFTAESVSVEALLEKGYDQYAAANFNALWTTKLGYFGYDMGIFSGILAGLMSAWIHNRFVDTRFNATFSFFEGTKFSIIMNTLISVPFGIAIYYVWPFIGTLLQNITIFIGNSGIFGTFAFGTLDKMLLPFGIHHLIAFPIEYSKLGGTMMVDGTMYEGVRNIMVAQAASPTETGYIVHNFTTGRVLFQLAGLPGAAFAMYKAALPQNRKKVASLLIPAVLTLALVGISEPIEYTFLFVAPILFFLVYAPLCGLMYVLAELAQIQINGHALFFMIPNIFQPHKVHAMALVWLLPLTFAIYYFIFKIAIEKFNLKTPGRVESDEVKLMSKKEYRELKDNSNAVNTGSTQEAHTSLEAGIIKALGGEDNIENITCCASRLRVEVKDPNLVASDDKWQNELEAKGVIRSGHSVQIIYGTGVGTILTAVKDLLKID